MRDGRLTGNRKFRGPMFDYSLHMTRLIKDIAEKCPELAHIDTTKILVAISRSRNRRKDGLQAKLVPMKFRGGRQVEQIGKDGYEMPNLFHKGSEILYLVYFCLPRFQNLSFDTKMTIIFHELYHISPSFNGDIRRFPGRCYQHSHSEKEYDRIVRELAYEYLKHQSSKDLTRFLRSRYDALVQQYGEISGLKIIMPEPILLKPKQGMLF